MEFAICLGLQYASNILNSSVVFFSSTSDGSLLETQARAMSLPHWPMQTRNLASFYVSDHLFASGPSSTSSISSLHCAQFLLILPAKSFGGTCLVAIFVFFCASCFFWVVRTVYYCIRLFFCLLFSFFFIVRNVFFCLLSSGLWVFLVVLSGFAILLLQ